MTHRSTMSRVLHFPGSAIRVEGPREDVAWVVQFLGPSFRSRTTGEAEWQVRMVRDTAAFEKRQRAGPDSRGRRKLCFFLDTRTESLPQWRGPRGATAVFDRAHQVFAYVRNRAGEVELLAPEEERMPRLALMRIVREHALSRLLESPGLLLHAASFEMDGKAALIIGEKRSGKTSLLLHALRQGRAWSGLGLDRGSDPGGVPVRYLANDRVWVSPGPGGCRAQSFPTIASLRLSSLEFFPEVAARLSESTLTTSVTLRESRLGWAPMANPWNGRQYALSPLQLCRLLRVEPAASAAVGPLLFPRITRHRGRIRMLPMSPEESEAKLAAGLFRAGLPQKAGGLFAAQGFPRRLNHESTMGHIRDLVRRVPCYSVEMGFQAYSDQAWLGRLRDRSGPPRGRV